MAEKTITFTPRAELKKGGRLLIKGFAFLCFGFAHAANALVRRYPYAVIFIVILVSFIVSMIEIGKARSERDSLNKENYQLQQKIDTIQMVNEAKEVHNYVYQN